MNHIIVAGNLGNDPEVRFTPSGQKVTTFALAVNGKKTEADSTTWFKVTIWGEKFDKMIPFLKKGSQVIATGELQKPEIYKEKVKLEIYADSIKFNPFGKPDAAQTQKPMAQGQSATIQDTRGHGKGTPKQDDFPF